MLYLHRRGRSNLCRRDIAFLCPSKRVALSSRLHFRPLNTHHIYPSSSQSLPAPCARDGSVRSLFTQITPFQPPVPIHEMENLSLDGPPAQAGLEARGQLLGSGSSPGPNQQLPPQMFTTAAQLLDMTDSECSVYSSLASSSAVASMRRISYASVSIGLRIDTTSVLGIYR